MAKLSLSQGYRSAHTIARCATGAIICSTLVDTTCPHLALTEASTSRTTLTSIISAALHHWRQHSHLALCLRGGIRRGTGERPRMQELAQR